MKVNKISFDHVNEFSNRDKTYQINPSVFNELYAFSPDIDGLKKAIESRKNFPIDRQALVDEIRNQYIGQALTPPQQNNIAALSNDNTFTVVTAHQPALFGGPMYYIYKIFSAINLAELLTQSSSNTIVPIFINGSEDHDFEEVNHFNLYGKSILWDHFQGGPVGRYNIDGLEEIIASVTSILGSNPNAERLINKLYDALHAAKDYNSFVFNFINTLFKEWGLIVLNMDNPAFKSLFSPIMKEELLSQSSAELIRATQAKLSSMGFGEQAYARDINLFYMKKGLRERIIKEDNHYIVNNTDLKFTEASILEELKNNPVSFSPNVIMRPLYEEAILPNIAYIGGGGELAYWLERKSQFAHFNVYFPCLIRRDSVLMVSKAQETLLTKFNISVEDLFLQEDRLIDKYLSMNTEVELTTIEEANQIAAAFDTLKIKAASADKTLEAYVEGEKNKVLKQIEQIESRVKRSLKKNEETGLNQIKNIRQKLFPDNGLQERTDNFIQYYNAMGDSFFDALKKELNPLDKNFTILTEV